MTEIRKTIEINAPPARVFRLIYDVERWHTWTASISSVRLTTPGPLAIGSTAEVRQPNLPMARWTVTALEEDLGFTWVSRSPGVRVTGEHWVTATPAGCRAALSISYGGFFGPLLGRLFRRISDRYVTMEAEGLKARAESASDADVRG
jgi:ribosome-associated toxin RatA of RatAB toxin-antitoxin module